jgi:hypothetical protein
MIVTEAWKAGRTVRRMVGDSQTMSGMTKKARDYLSAGAKLAWIVDAAPRHVALTENEAGSGEIGLHRSQLRESMGARSFSHREGWPWPTQMSS